MNDDPTRVRSSRRAVLAAGVAAAASLATHRAQAQPPAGAPTPRPEREEPLRYYVTLDPGYIVLGSRANAVPGGLAGSTVRAGRLVEGEPLVRPRGLAHVVRYVADVERSAAFYRRFFGAETRTPNGVEFRAAYTRWILEPAPRGEAPRIDRFGVNVAHYDGAAVERGLTALGARVVTSSPERLHFRCPDGLGVELLPVDPARIWGLA